MKTLSSLLFTVLTVTSFSQITITKPDFGDAGDTVRFSQTMDPTLDLTATGPNYTWDYSNFIANSQYVKEFSMITQAGPLANISFGQFAPAQYQADYFTSATQLPLDQLGGLLPISISAIYQVTKLTDVSTRTVGAIMAVNGNNIPVKSDTIEVRYPLPLNFGDVYDSRGYSNLDMNPLVNAQWIQHRERHSSVDGWGTITTPLGTFNALRVVHEILETDSFYVDFQGVGFWVPIPIPLTKEYEWWTNGKKDPILKVTAISSLIGETITSIEYQDNYDPSLSVQNETLIESTVYPNPSQGIFEITTSTELDEYVVYSMEGRIIRQGNLNGSQKFSLDLSAESNGIYLLEMGSGIARTRTQLVKH